MTEHISVEEANSISRISSLVMINAMIFQEILAYHDGRVFSLERILDEDNLQGAFTSHWLFILSDINYYPIFHLARELIKSLTSNPDTTAGLRNLARAAQKIVSMRAALRHDLMGRVYHRLLADKKYLGTYYTRIPAAVMLLKLTLEREAFKVPWHDLEALADFRIADLACGTGTLLMAAADALTDNYFHASAQAGSIPNPASIHKLLAEKIIFGYDVLASAIHLTASTLALRAPEIAFEKMNLFSLPFGGKQASLGSLEFLKGKDLNTKDLFGAILESRQMSGGGELELSQVRVPELDVCVMNPPFTRSVIGNLLFGSFPEKERQKMQASLKVLVKNRELHASITAGLGAVFIALADRYLKPNGRLALVIPKAILSGVSWEPTRQLLSNNYQLEYLIASHDPEKWNFSESTNLSEVLLIARKTSNHHNQTKDHPVISINLRRNPATSFDALAAVQSLKNSPLPEEFPGGQGALELFLGKEKVGEVLTFNWGEMRRWSMWMLPCAFAQSDLIRAAHYLLQGQLWLPGYGVKGQIPLMPLKEFGSLGPDGRDIHDGFRLSEAPTAYPAFWGYDAQAVFSMGQSPNAYLSPLHLAKDTRPLRKVEDLWPRAGKILLGARLRLNTRSVWAILLAEPVLSNVWWPFSFKEKFDSEKYEKALVLWCNSTLALLMLLANRQETEGAWVQFKKPVLAHLPVMDLTSLSEDQLGMLAAAYDEMCQETLQPFPEMDGDPVRARIDQAIAQVLGLPDFSILRRLLAREPVVCLKRL